VATVRYLIADVERSIAFYTKALGFKLDQSMAPVFARVSNNDLTLWLAGPRSLGRKEAHRARALAVNGRRRSRSRRSR
jgi:glyoxylase I family protein